MFIILQEIYHGIKKCERFGRTEQLSWCYIWFLTIGSRNSPTDAPGCLIKLMIPGGWKHLCKGVCVASSAQSCPQYHDEQISVSSTMAALVAQNMSHSQALINRINTEQKCSADVLALPERVAYFHQQHDDMPPLVQLLLSFTTFRCSQGKGVSNKAPWCDISVSK